MKKIRIILVVVIFIAVIGVIIPIIINELYKVNNGYITVWDGSTALAYYGTLIGGLGTIVLGIVAWKQNKRILEIEESRFLADNAISVIISEINIIKIGQLACNLEEHVEQIVATNEVKKLKNFLEFGTGYFVCKMKPMYNNQHIPLINVKSMTLSCVSETNKRIFHMFAYGEMDQYSRVAMHKGYDSFQITVMMSKEENNNLIKSINKDSKIQIELELSLLTDKYVATELKCRTLLGNPEYNDKEKVYINFKEINKKSTMCFWEGNRLKKKDTVRIKAFGG